MGMHEHEGVTRSERLIGALDKNTEALGRVEVLLGEMLREVREDIESAVATAKD